MGLDVYAYNQAKKLDALFTEDGDAVNPVTREPYENWTRAVANPDFPGREEGLSAPWVYEVGEVASSWHGGYGRYNGLRNELAKFAGYPGRNVDRYNTGNIEVRYDHSAWEVDAGPFWEMICFSDCEGVIGPVVAAKLAKDFAEHDCRAKEWGQEFYAFYTSFRECFEAAANGGFVKYS